MAKIHLAIDDEAKHNKEVQKGSIIKLPCPRENDVTHFMMLQPPMNVKVSGNWFNYLIQTRVIQHNPEYL